MEGIKNLNLNVDVTIYSPAKSTDPAAQIFKGRIYNRETDDNVVIELDSDNGAGIFTSGKPILLFLAHDLGLYIFSAIIARTGTEHGRTILYCGKTEQVRYFQRRKTVRVNVNLPVSFSAEFNRSQVWEGNITNISVGGLQLVAPFPVPADSVLELVFQLEEVGPMFMDGKVVRAFERDGGFVHGIEFLNIDQLCIDGIARFIMAEQSRQKRLGLNVFKAFLLKATVETHTPTVFSIVRFKNLDISALQGKKCNGNIIEIGIHDLYVECPLKLPVGAVLEFSMELPKLGYTTMQAVVSEVNTNLGKFAVKAQYASDYEGIRDHVLERLAEDVDLPYINA